MTDQGNSNTFERETALARDQIGHVVGKVRETRPTCGPIVVSLGYENRPSSMFPQPITAISSGTFSPAA